MSQLHYKTRGNSTPQGKSRVCFCCHPADFEACFEPVSEEILGKQNCAIWYVSPSDLGEGFLPDDLEQMQLLVIPVTCRFLKEPNYARDAAFPYAMEHHIPVLPLLQENGLESLFNEVCGDLQMLDKNNRDRTAIPYEEKLEKFLSAALVGDELAAKVRAAFDAYIFLSYRKKDRQYAKQLMRLIHKNDFCRDIAIWYDEFLTPGENFNDAIADALKKSCLFALAITPNVVNEPNYVMSIEYPMARDSAKPLLPVELAPTDREALLRNYAGLPECIRAEDEEALAESLRRIAVQENDSSPEHNFFIGLAYLAGIDVEVDHEKARSLITGAAENGLPEAARKLAAMYRHGEGVARDYQTAIFWQQKLTALLQASFEQEPSAQKGELLLAELWELGDYNMERKQREEAKAAFEQMLDLSRRLNDEVFQSRDSIRYFAVASSQLALLYMEDGQYEEAERCCRKGLLVLRLAEGEALTVKVQSDINILNQRLGLICQEQGRCGEASQCYQECLKGDIQLLEQTDWTEFKYDISVDYMSLGNLYRTEAKWKEAGECHEKSLAFAVQYYEETKTALAKENLARCHANLGYLAEQEENLEAAKTAYTQSLTLFEEVAKELETIDSRRNAAEVSSMLGRVCYAQGKASRGRSDEAGAEALFRQAANYLRRAHETLQTAALKKILVNALVFVGDSCGDTGRIEEARECYAESLSLCRELRKQRPEGTDEAEIKEQHIGVCLRLVDSLRALNRQEEGMAAANEGVREALAFYQEQPNFRNRCNLAMAYAKYGQVCCDAGRIEEAKLLFTEEVRYRQENAQEGCSYPYYNLYCDSLERLGEVCAELEQWGEAATHFGASLRLRQAIYKAENGRTPYKRSYAHTCSRLADAARQMGDVGNARGLYNAELTLREELLEEEGKTLANLDALATACYRLGTVDPDRQDSELVKQAFLIWYSLHKAYPENEQITRKVEFIKRLLL